MKRLRRLQVSLCLVLGATAGCLATPEDIEQEAAEVGSTAQALSATGYGSVAWEDLDGATLSELKAQLPLLQGKDIALVLHWKAENIHDPARWDVVHEAYSRGIRVYPWLTLPESMGYFPNATNYDTWIGYAQYLMFWWRVNGLPSTTMMVDMEISKDKLHQFQALTATGDAIRVAQFLNGNINRNQFAQATQAYRGFVDYAHSLGFKVALTTLLPLLDDYADGDDFLRQGFNCPIDGIPWDEVSFQAQRSLYGQSYPLTSYMVYDYGRLARQRFGSRAGISLGLTHAGISPDPSVVYTDGNQLRLDVEAARAAGFSADRVGVYSFLGIFRRAPASQWFQTPNRRTPLPDLGTGLLHASIRTIDSLDWAR